MFFTILAYLIAITAILAYFATQIFPFTNLLGPHLGSSKKAITKWRRAIKGRKWEKKMFGIKDTWFWIK
ncbi:hypothetical protein ES703_91914 [subsurface metagenome]